MNTSETLNITILQSDLVWENPSENRRKFEEKIKSISSTIDLIILPEMFTTGFTMNAKNLAETMDGNTINWMKKLAKEKQIAIVGSIIISENDAYYNRLLFVHPSEKVETYDKRHTFTLAGEHKIFSSGNHKLIIDYKGWKICPLICYDLRFPVWARNMEDYDILIYIASWPKPRIEAWDSLLKARAIENMCYTIGVNRVGKDINDYEYSGNSIFLDCLGNNLSESIEESSLKGGQEMIISKTFFKTTQDKLRNKFNFLNDKDNFTIT